MAEPIAASADLLADGSAPADLSVSDLSVSDLRALLLARAEVALIDLREESAFATGHPLWAANLPLARIEADAPRRIPRRAVPVVLYGEEDGHDLTTEAARRFGRLGYTRLYRLAGGLTGWAEAGQELFIDVNVPSKAFGELVAEELQTPLIQARALKALVEAGGAEAPVILDSRRPDEYRTMTIPGAISVPGAELVLRAPGIAGDAKRLVVVNCAGRTRSIIGTQSLLNAGIAQPVVGLRNGTIGWVLEGLPLELGAARDFAAFPPDGEGRAEAARRAHRVAKAAGVPHLLLNALKEWGEGRTLYRIDVRTEAEFLAGHLPDFRHVPGGQLVQETDHTAPVRGARFALADDDGVRANMTASWLAQMGWEVAVVLPDPDHVLETGAGLQQQTDLPPGRQVDATALAAALAGPHPPLVLDLSLAARYRQGHVPGAVWARRADVPALVSGAGRAVVLVCQTGVQSAFAREGLGPHVATLAGGTAGWSAAGFALTERDAQFTAPPVDRYRRPYEGMDPPPEAMQAYLDWEFGLVAQLGRDGTHFFRVLRL